jgi:hypothetical protein
MGAFKMNKKIIFFSILIIGMALVFPQGIEETDPINYETTGHPLEIIANNYSTNPTTNNSPSPLIINQTGNETIPPKPELKPFVVDYIWDGTQWVTLGGWLDNSTNTTNSTNNTI